MDEQYESPIILLIGSITDITGAGGNDHDDCSSGYWQNDPSPDE